MPRDLFQENQGASKQPVDLFASGGISMEDPVAPTQPASLGQKIRNIPSAVMQGPTLGFADELTSYPIAGIDYLINRARGGQDSFRDIYNRVQSEEEQRLNKVYQDAPIISNAAELIGGAGVAAPVAGITSKILQSAPRLARYAGNVGLGSLASGAYSAGKAEVGEDPTQKAQEGALMGGALTAVSPLLAPVVGLAKKAISPLIQSGEKIAEKQVSRALKDISDDQIKNALSVQRELAEQGVPITIGEALGSGNLTEKFGSLLRNPESKDIVENFLQKRAEKSLPEFQRGIITKATDSAVQNAEEAGRSLIETAQIVEDNARKELSDKAKPLYERAFYNEKGKPRLLNGPKVTSLSQNDNVQAAIEWVKGNNPFIEGLPNNSFPVIDAAASYLQKASRRASDPILQTSLGNQARNLRNALEDQISGSEGALNAYKEARKVYAEGSEDIERLIQSRLGNVASLKTAQEPQAFAKIMAGSPTQIARARDQLSKVNPRAYKDALSSYLHQSLEKKMREGATPTLRSVFQSNVLEDKKLRAALGKEGYEAINKYRQVFRQIERTQGLKFGSPTAQREIYDDLSGVTNPKAFALNKITQKLEEKLTQGDTQKLFNLMTSEEGLKLADKIITSKGSQKQKAISELLSNPIFQGIGTGVLIN